jgi:hypothetical protein
MERELCCQPSQCVTEDRCQQHRVGPLLTEQDHCRQHSGARTQRTIVDNNVTGHGEPMSTAQRRITTTTTTTTTTTRESMAQRSLWTARRTHGSYLPTIGGCIIVDGTEDHHSENSTGPLDHCREQTNRSIGSPTTFRKRNS